MEGSELSEEIETREYAVPLRWRDFDRLGHVYHGTYVTLLDQARIAFLEDHSLHSDHVVASIAIDFFTELGPEADEVRVTFAVEKVGNSSVHLIEEMSAGGVLRARCRTVLVMWDSERRRAKNFTEEERSSIAGLEIATEGAA